ncbi:MAG: hypothetical protein PHH65_09330 [Eubacteriales bacterium]|jgi:hypothetical protein|nr:hypothetical protein [Eubacteriales bacterium]
MGGCDSVVGPPSNPQTVPGICSGLTEGNICNTHDFRHVPPMRKRDIAPIALMVWMLTVSNLMGISYGSDLKYFIAVALVGFFVILYLIHPVFSKPGYIRNIYRMGIVCAALFCLIIILRVLELIEYLS